MTLALLKLVCCTFMAFGSLTVFLYTRNKPWRDRLYRALILSSFAFRIIAPIIIYSLKLPFTLTSDAANYYMPQALQLLSGQLPYSDFPSSYSPFFLPLIALALTIWHSVGSIVITMTLVDGSLVAVYLFRCRRKKVTYGWSVAFLYSFCPISFYWIGVVGHNGSIIAFATMMSLIMAEQKREYFSGLLIVAGFLFSKLLAVMYWPITVYYRRGGRFKRALPVAICVILFAGLVLFGFDPLSPIRNEFSKYTSGNIWYFLSRLAPGFLGSTAWHLLSVISFATIFIVLFLLYIRTEDSNPEGKFDQACAYAAAITLLFLILSKKSNTFYITMGLLPLIHTLIQGRRHLLRRLAPLAFIGSITTIELFLWHNPSFSDNALSSFRGIVFILMEMLLLFSYIYWTILCFKESVGPGKQLQHIRKQDDYPESLFLFKNQYIKI